MFDNNTIHGFLDARHQVCSQSEEEHLAWNRLVVCWAKAFGESAVSVNDLAPIVEKNDSLTSFLGGSTGQSSHTRLGKALSRMQGREFTGCRILQRPDDRHRKVQTYRLAPIETHKVPVLVAEDAEPYPDQDPPTRPENGRAGPPPATPAGRRNRRR